MASLNNNSNNNNNENVKIDLKKFPQYRKGECPKTFLISFEHACWDYKVNESEKMSVLRSQVSGDLADFYSQMPLDQARDFDMFRKMVYA